MYNQVPKDVLEKAKQWLISVHWEAVLSFDLDYAEDGLYTQVINSEDFPRFFRLNPPKFNKRYQALSGCDSLVDGDAFASFGRYETGSDVSVLLVYCFICVHPNSGFLACSDLGMIQPPFLILRSSIVIKMFYTYTALKW
jgi:hypothetical protein